jgi:uncharacterized protein
MLKIFRNLSAKPFGVQLIAFIFLCMIGAFLSMLGSYIALYGTGFSLKAYQAATDYYIPQWVAATIRLQIVSTILMFGLPALAFGFISYPSTTTYLGLKKAPRFSHLVLAVAALILSYGLVAYLAQLNKVIPMPNSFVALESKAEQMTRALLQFRTVPKLLLTLFYIALLPALLEELFFRACLQNILIQHFTKAKAWYAIIITAVIFALLHGQMQTLFPRIFLGLLLGLLYYYSGSLWVSIAVHFFNNGLQVFANYLFQQHTIQTDLSENPNVSLSVALLSALLCSAMVYKMYSRKENYICHIAQISTDEQLD